MSDDEVDKSGRDIFSRTEADRLTHHCRSVVKSESGVYCRKQLLERKF